MIRICTMNGPFEHRFDVYGQPLAVQRRGSEWAAWWLGAEGKRRAAGFAIPEFVAEDELANFLADLFHESARPGHDDVTPMRAR